jgi:4-hydroxy-3-polyprenylbenzoate decarboxylase
MRIILAITGSSGTIYGIRLLEELKKKEIETIVIVSEIGKEIMEYETSYSLDYVRSLSSSYFENDDLFAPVASGSFKFDSFVVAPCSLSTLAKIANGIADDLITRTGSVSLKERRRIVLVPREMPLDSVALRNMLNLSQLGVIIASPIPAFYNKPQSMDEMINFVVGKVMDSLGIENDLYKRYTGKE